MAKCTFSGCFFLLVSHLRQLYDLLSTSTELLRVQNVYSHGKCTKKNWRELASSYFHPRDTFKVQHYLYISLRQVVRGCGANIIRKELTI